VEDSAEKKMMIPIIKRMAKDFSVRIPYQIRKSQGIKPGDVLILRIRKEGKETRTTLSLYKQGKIYIPKDVQDMLGLKEHDILEICIEEKLEKEE